MVRQEERLSPTGVGSRYSRLLRETVSMSEDPTTHPHTSHAEHYEGGCHCGAVRFAVEVVEHLAFSCNCSMCRKMGFLHVIVPPERFRILQGEDALSVYRFNTRVAAHMFCRTCGIHPFYRPRSHPNDWDVNALCLDDGASARFRVEPFDGDRWEQSVSAIADRRS